MIEVVTAPPFATVQDLGRPGYRAQGVPLAGAMDPPALRAANALVGNPDDAAAIEWAVGAGTLAFGEARRIAVTGAAGELRLAERRVAAYEVAMARAGAMLHVGAPVGGRFVYVAIEGGIDVPIVLGSRSTYLAGRFGGLGGRTLRRGDGLPVGDTTGSRRPVMAPPSDRDGVIRVVRGPHRRPFTDTQWTQFLAGELRIAPASDRTGYRLTGSPLSGERWGILPSEPVCPGAIQITAGGQPIVLMADAPTVGGYPIIAVVHSADLPTLAQRQVGDLVRFREVAPG